MNPAEFRTLREQLFLTEKDLSMLTLVKESQIKAWELGDVDVPLGTAGLLQDIDNEIERRIGVAIERGEALEKITLVRFQNPAIFKREGPDMSPIPTFLAFKCHCALISRLRVAFKAQHKRVFVKYYSPSS